MAIEGAVASTTSVEETFTFLPLSLDPQTKAISSTDSQPSSALTTELTALNSLHRSLLRDLESPHTIPPPPVPVPPKRSLQITKLRDTAVSFYKKSQFPDAIRLYSLAIDMALQRPSWEAAGLVREEVAMLYALRSDAYMGAKMWAEAAVDAETSVEVKRVGNGRSWVRRGLCLREMGRGDEVGEWVEKALEWVGVGEEGRKELEGLREEVEKKMERR